MADNAVKCAAIYVRISRDTGGDQAGVARQEKDCRALAKRLGWSVAGVYRDDDVSAYSGRHRPAYEELIDAIMAGQHDAVLVYHLDRLQRSTKELERFLDICAAANMTRLQTVHGDFDLGNNDSIFTARILAAVARKESDDKSRRIKRKLEENALEGKPHGGRYGYGYTASGDIDEEQAAIICDMADAFDAGEALTSIARRLNDAGTQSPGGKQWQAVSVRSVLNAARISGRREHNGHIITAGTWPAIISPEQSDRIRGRLASAERKTRRVPRRRLLAHLLRCGLCGNELSPSTAHRNGVGKPYYVCKSSASVANCGKIAVVAEQVEELIVAGVLLRLEGPALAEARARKHSHDKVQRSLDTALQNEEHRLDELAAAFGRGDVTMKEWLTARKPIERKIAELKQQLAYAGGDTVLAALPTRIGIRSDFNNLNLSRQAAIIAAVLDHAMIFPAKPGPKFDPNRVQPIWRV